MKKILILLTIMSLIASAEELKIQALSFSADEGKGISIFDGNVSMVKRHDELYASKVTVYTDKENKPIKFVAFGNVSFKIETKTKAKYEGSANKVIFFTKEREYRFYKNVHLKQINEKKEIQGDEVVLSTVTGKAHAKGVEKGPVIMIFDIPEKE